MASSTVKEYTITGPKRDSHHLEIHQSGIPFLWANSNNKHGPWKSPYVTMHEGASNGEIVAAAKMGYPACARNFKIYQGNPDCTDLNTWPVVKCMGKWASEYKFQVEVERQSPLQFAWRRTRDKSLGARAGREHRDFKLVAFDPLPVKGGELSRISSIERDEKHILDLDIEEPDPGHRSSIDEIGGATGVGTQSDANRMERIVGIYIHEPSRRTSPRQARINLFEELPWEIELWCLTVVMGLQEKISRNLDAFTCGSVGYGGGMRPLGYYV